MRPRRIEVFVSDFGKHGHIISQIEIVHFIVFEFKLFPDCSVRVNNLVIHRKRSRFNSEELIQQSLVALTHAKWRDQVYLSVDHKQGVDFTFLILVSAVSLALINIESVLLDSRYYLLGVLAKAKLIVYFAVD